MSKRFLFLPALLLAVPAWAQTASPEVELAGMHEDIRGLSQRLADLTLRVEQLEAENASLRDQAKSTQQNSITLAQLNEAIADLDRTIQSSIAAAKNEMLQQGEAQPATPARGTNPHALAPTGFSDDFPKEGVTYTVKSGDTLALIAKQTGAKISDIVNANKIADPSRILAGQALFIPGGK